jgi:hypothetical protein
MKNSLLIGRAFGSMLAVLLIAAAFLFTAFDEPLEVAGIGTRSYMVQDVADTVTSSTTFVATDLSFPLAANQKVHARFFVPITLGGTASGIKFQVNAPASPTAYVSAVTLFADDNSVGLVSVVNTEGAQGVTLANAGNHVAVIDVTITNGSTAGTVTLEFAQNVQDAAAAIVQRGAYVDITKL